MEKVTQGQKALIINSWRSGRSPEEAGLTMTVDELIGLLEWYPPDMPVIIRGYDEYQFTSVNDESIQEEILICTR